MPQTWPWTSVDNSCVGKCGASGWGLEFLTGLILWSWSWSLWGWSQTNLLDGNETWPEVTVCVSGWLKLLFRFIFGMKFMRQAAPAVDSWVNSTWNPRAEVSLDNFFVPTMDDQGKKRLAVLGNVVVPPQASMGAAVLFSLAGMERCSD